MGSLQRIGDREVTYVSVLSADATTDDCRRSERQLKGIAADDAADSAEVRVLQSDSAAEAVIQQASQADLLVLGAQRHSRRNKAFGRFTLNVARGTTCPLILISRRG